MLIQPVTPIVITIKYDQSEIDCQMISLTEYELVIQCNSFIEKESKLIFYAKYFKGLGILKETQYSKHYFIYTLNIEQINFQPGLLINTRL